MAYSSSALQISAFLFLAVFSISLLFPHLSEAADEPVFSYPDVFNDPDRDALITGTFTEGFVWGSATSAYQIEGAWNVDGKGESIWDNFTHIEDPTCRVNNCENGDVACDSYNKYETDVMMLKDLGVTHYRFSLSWPRIMPTGEGDVNEAGLQYYDRLIDALIAEGIVPVITLYHWDLPKALQDKYGGWEGEELAEIFNAYADICFARWADKVNMWITHNEPYVVCWLGYGVNVFAPGIYDPGFAPYRCAHNIIRSHGMAYRTYEKKYRPTYGGLVSITLSTDYGIPDDPNNPADVEAAIRYMQFTAGWFAHPVMINGDYPDVMKWKVGNKSIEQGLSESRLPVFTDADKEMIKGTGDFFGLNCYTSLILKDQVNDDLPNYESDQDVVRSRPDEWPTSASEWLRPVPWGMRGLLNWVKDEYNLPVYITENGVSTPLDSYVDDETRTTYYRAYINEVLKAYKEDGVDVRGYFAWSLMDNFEWSNGYGQRFGMHHVDFDDDNRPRTRKDSADFFSQLIKDNGFSAATTSTPAATMTTITSAATNSTISLMVLLISICLRFLH